MCPQLEDVYGEVFRVLKPGSLFVSYEWVSTHKYDPKNPEHVRIMDEINYGNGLPVSAVTHWLSAGQYQCLPTCVHRPARDAHCPCNDICSPVLTHR